MVDIYFRNPEPYIVEAVDAGVNLFSWDTGDFVKRNIDPLRFLSIFVGIVTDWKLLTIAIEGAAEYNKFSIDLDHPVAVYPSWRFEYGFDKLENYCKKPVGEDEKVYGDNSIKGRFRPVKGQPHKVLIYDAPDMSTAVGKNYFRHLRAMKARYPHVEFIIHNTASFRVIFGVEFDGACIDPYMSAKFGSLLLPTGIVRKAKELGVYRSWVNVLGYSLTEVGESRDVRVQYNIDSIRWAEQNYKENLNFRVRVLNNIDPEAPDDEVVELLTASHLTSSGRVRGSAQAGDGIICGSCSLALHCKYFRDEAVCSVPKSSSAELVKMFGTRDASLIIDGLVQLAEIQAERVAKDLEEEDENEERLPATDKRIKDLFESGVKVAKLIDPSLNGKRDVNVNVGVLGGAAVIAQSTPQELMSRAVAALEAKGIAREDITPEMIGGLLEGMQNREVMHRTIEGTTA